jgi:NAD(P)-dependent dehydrogenase (short-subunit alcohol dehydrogenase family)
MEKPAVLITGAGSGIGRATAEALCGSHRVYAGARDPEALRGLPQVEPLALDVADTDSVRRAVDCAVRAAGGRLAAIVNNAGESLYGPLEVVPIEAVERLFRVNVIGAMDVARCALPALAAGGGRVVNVGSVSGLVGFPFTSAYAASKHALEGVTSCLRAELRPLGIGVAIVNAHWIDTPMLERSLDRARGHFAGASESVRARYAGLARLLEKAAVRGTVPVKEAADVVRRAVTDAELRDRYVVGVPEPVAGLLERLAASIASLGARI